MQFRAEFFNIFNHTQFNGLVGGSGNIVASNFGYNQRQRSAHR